MGYMKRLWEEQGEPEPLFSEPSPNKVCAHPCCDVVPEKSYWKWCRLHFRGKRFPTMRIETGFDDETGEFEYDYPDIPNQV